ncbi:hypothetical protein [Streptomyces cinnamoneus]|nr:hypothetical protein [Streptomyces cinnamoneus]
MKTTVAASEASYTSYGLGLARIETSCGTTLWGHGGGMIGWLSMAVTTADGRHQLAYNYNYNGDWDATSMSEIIEAEYCSTSP